MMRSTTAELHSASARGNGLAGFNDSEFECRVLNRPLKTKLNFGAAAGLHIELPEIEVRLRAVNRETECGHGVVHVYLTVDVFKFEL
jgi:hypothetical protein